jgi:glutamate formiminotransferase / formiminotetrahydrofolate cyclodeaminase
MKVAFQCVDILRQMVEQGNQNSITDAGVGLLCIKTAVRGAYFNVMINAKGLSNKQQAAAFAEEAKQLLKENHTQIDAILQRVEEAIAF